MVRILLILVAVAAVNALAWVLAYLNDASSLGGSADWSPMARTVVSTVGRASMNLLMPFFWIDRWSHSLWITCVSGVVLEAAIIEVALRLYGVGKSSRE